MDTMSYLLGKKSGGSGGTTNYSELSNKPQINNTELNGNKTSSDLGLQDELVSGTNIKTINNQTLLGEGNINIESGGGKRYEIILDDNDGNFVDYNTTHNKEVFQEIYDNFDSINASDIYIYGSYSLAVFNVNSISKKNNQLRIIIDYNFDSSSYTKFGTSYVLVSRNELYSNFLNGEVGDISKYRTTTYRLSQLNGGLGVDNTTSYTPTGNYNPSTKLYTDKTHYENMAGYDNTKTQILKNVNGTLTWVDE